MISDSRDRGLTVSFPDLENKKPKYETWAGVIGGLVNRRKPLENYWRKLYADYRRTIEELSSDEISVNMTYGNTRVLEAMLYYQDPYLRVRPLYDPNQAPKAKLLEDNLNHTYYQERVGKEIKKCIIDAGLVGFGVAMVGFSDYHEANTISGQGSGRVYVRRVNPIDIYVEDDIIDFRDATIWARRGTYSVRWLKKRFPKYEWKAQMSTELQRRRGLTQSYPSQAELFEVHDMVNQRVLILSPQHNEIIHQQEFPYGYYNGPAYVVLEFSPDPERLYAISMTGVVMGQQYELDALRTMQMVHRKRFNRRYVTNKSMWEEEELEKIEFGEDGTIAFTKGDPEKCLYPVPDANLDPGTTRDYQIDIKQDMREILGINEYSKAGVVPRTKTATEAQMVQQGSNIRSMNLYTCVHDFVIDIARRMSLVLQNEYDGIYYFTKRDEASDQITQQQWTKEDILGDFDVEMELGSTMAPQPLPYEMLVPMAGAGGGGNPPGTNGGGGMPTGGPEAAQAATQAGMQP